MVRDLGELGINLQKIVSRLFANQNFLKLLYYTDKDPLSHSDLTETQIQQEIYEKLVKVVPRVGPKETSNSIVSMRVVYGRRNTSNNEFQDISIQFEVFVPMTQWFIKDSNLRPFCIISQLQKSLDGKVVNGLGRLACTNFSLNFLTDEISCYEVNYSLTDYE